MIGVNDVARNDFMPADATRVAQFVRAQRLAGLHYWSFDRDTPCPRPPQGASPICSGLSSVAAGAYGKALGLVVR